MNWRFQIAILCFVTALTSFPKVNWADDVVYNRVKQSTVWIVCRDGSSGSGVLVDASRRLVVTNAHVVDGNRTVVVFAPVVDTEGEIWSRTSYNRSAKFLSQNGYGAVGTVIARSQSTDLAILRLDRPLKGTQEIEIADRDPDIGDGLHIVGNPAERPLFHYSYGGTSYVGRRSWTYKDGHYMNAEVVRFHGRTWFGNSGGPVVNDDAELVGVLAAAGQTTSTAIHMREVRRLLDTVTWHRVFSIRNDTNGPISYSVRTRSGGDWKQYTLQPGRYHLWWLTYDPQVKISFDCSYVHGSQAKSYDLSTYNALWGQGLQPAPAEGKQYRFARNGSGLELYRIN